ncbi:PIR protein CIR protein [Plasmodium vinckei brucechwatti]|uniref:PIR protein CIR protein n=1 Tax=Plasmodium vinckei brucechwatti TaxID=119398 RepID=A0A6V7RU59_PLAVN|nr:PIR protein CIR protein [Plasmodium vinckei brucechwatti]
MEPKELCKNFLDADKIINDENDNNLAHRQIINDPKFKEYCSNIDCETDMQINGFGEYLFNQLGTQIENEYYEYFMMWLSDKLFEIAKEDDESQIEDITLNSAYEKYLKKNIKNGIYWSLLDIKKELKEVNLKYMKQFYKLLNHICEAIVYYNSSKDDTEKFINYSSDCSNQYLSLYNSVPKCDSYLHLLDNLKKTYEGFKNSVHEEIKNNYPDLEGRLKTLTIENTSSYFVEKLKEFDFSDEKCKPQKAKEPGSSKKMEQPPGPQSASQKSGTSPQSGKKDSDKGQGGSKSEKTDSGTQKGNSDSEGGGKGGTSNLSGSTGGGSGSGTGDTSGGQSDQGGSSGGSGSQGDSSNQGGSDGGLKGPGDQVPTPPSGDSNIYLPNNWEMSFNLTRYMPNFYGIYQSSKDILTNATNQVSNAYNSAMTIAQDTYNKTVTAVKDAYDNTMTTVKGAYSATTNYIRDGFSSITSQLSSLDFFSQLGDDQSGSGSSGNGSSTENSPLKTLQTPESDPNSLPPSQSQSPSQSSSNQPREPPQPLPSPKEPSSIHGSQDTVQNGASNTLQQPVPVFGTGVQTMTITQATLSSSNTDPSITWSGSITEMIVKMSEKSSIWCIAQNKKYGILGIGIISISIFAFLAIMYKYLSLGCTSKSKRKKSMKKVINSIGGKRPVQIIIKSYDRNKDLKPIINSADRKKDPLLNIYKLMQADPIPFINLFFLLIFFVYKRQLNYLEL